MIKKANPITELPISPTKDEPVLWLKDVIAERESIAEELERIASYIYDECPDCGLVLPENECLIEELRALAKELRE